MELKHKLLAKHLGITPGELDPSDYLVLTDDEATDQARAYILESIWAFRPSFLAGHCELDEEVIQAIVSNGKCEGNNEVLRRLLVDEEHFIEDALLADGRGHFLSSYDGEEIELVHRTPSGRTKYWYAYRLN